MATINLRARNFLCRQNFQYGALKMKKLFLMSIAIFCSWSWANVEILGVNCGSRGNLWGTIASEYLIPDYFPPENHALRQLLISSTIDLSMCEEDFSAAYLGNSCIAHDECYSTVGAPKERCDRDLKRGWIAACELNYPPVSVSGALCRSVCKEIINVMYQAMSYDNGSFCPSCRAYEDAQREPH